MLDIGRLQRRLHAGTIVRMDQVQKIAVLQFVEIVAECRGPRGIGVKDVGGGVEQGNRRRLILDQRPEPSLVPRQTALGSPTSPQFTIEEEPKQQTTEQQHDAGHCRRADRMPAGPIDAEDRARPP